MQLPPQISFRDFPNSVAVEQNILARIEHLEKLFDQIISCRVVVGEARKATPRGTLFYCHVDLKVPQKEIPAGRRTIDGAHKDLYVAIRDAFDDVERQLRDYVRTRRVRVHLRHHEEPAHGKVIRIIREGPGDEGYGFLRTVDGRELYFHSHSVLNRAFDKLAPGVEVRFSEGQGEEGAQASTVEIVGHDGKHVAGLG